jgi:hypothetical protein
LTRHLTRGRQVGGDLHFSVVKRRRIFQPGG